MRLEKRNGKWVDVEKLEAKPNKAIKKPERAKHIDIPTKGKKEPKK